MSLSRKQQNELGSFLSFGICDRFLSLSRKWQNELGSFLSFGICDKLWSLIRKLQNELGSFLEGFYSSKNHDRLFFTNPVQKADIRSNPLGLLIMQYMECNRTAELTQILSPIQNRSNEMVLDILQSDAYFVPECCQTRNACIDPYMDGLYVPVNTVNIPVIEMPKYMTQIENIC